MSHFSVHVLVPRRSTVAAYEQLVATALAPFDEAMEVEPYKDDDDEMTTYNPASQWDWWAIGGRWNGAMIGYDPESDPENMEPCQCCGGSGTRPNGLRDYGEAWVKATNGCNGCGGKGVILKFPTRQKSVGNILPVSELLPRLKDDDIPFAILTPEGEWIQKGKMGWWASVSDEKDENAWNAEARAIYQKFSDAIIVLVDCHI